MKYSTLFRDVNAPITIQYGSELVKRPKKPVVGQTEPTRPEMTAEDVLEIASRILARDRNRRMASLSGINRLRSLGGGK